MNHEYFRRRHWVDTVVSVSVAAADALGVVLYLLLVDVFVVLGVGGALLAPFVLPFLVFVPGYALVSALFPRAAETGDYPRQPFADAVAGGLTWLERTTLSFGTSVTLLPLLALVHSVTGIRYSQVALLAGLTAFVVVCLGVSVYRRTRLPPGEQLLDPVYVTTARLRTTVARRARSDVAVAVVAVVLALVATSTLVGAVVTPTDGEQYTTLTLLNESESGDLVTGNYPREFEVGEARPVVVGVENHEGQRVTYTVTTQLQAVGTVDGERAVLDTVELGRTQQAVDAGESWLATQSVQPTRSGENLRVAVLLYVGDPPQNPSVETADRVTHFWITVTDESG